MSTKTMTKTTKNKRNIKLNPPRDLITTLEKHIGDRKAAETVSTYWDNIVDTVVEEMQTSFENHKAQSKFELREELSKELASKEDLTLAKTELNNGTQKVRNELNASIQDVRNELHAAKTELKTAIQDVRNELQEVKTELYNKIDTIVLRLEHKLEKNDLMLKIIIALFIFATTLANPGFIDIVKSIVG